MRASQCTYFLCLLTTVNTLCEFDNHHNKRFEAGASEILDTVHVRGAAQCKQACVAYEGQCAAVNLKFSGQSGGFTCELLMEGTNFDPSHLSTDHDCTFMQLQGEQVYLFSLHSYFWRRCLCLPDISSRIGHTIMFAFNFLIYFHLQPLKRRGEIDSENLLTSQSMIYHKVLHEWHSFTQSSLL